MCNPRSPPFRWAPNMHFFVNIAETEQKSTGWVTRRAGYFSSIDGPAVRLLRDITRSHGYSGYDGHMGNANDADPCGEGNETLSGRNSPDASPPRSSRAPRGGELKAAGAKPVRRTAKDPDDVGRALRSVYDNALREDVPDDFLDLLGKLN